MGGGRGGILTGEVCPLPAIGRLKDELELERDDVGGRGETEACGVISNR